MISSAVEHLVYTEGVSGSNPLSPTMSSSSFLKILLFVINCFISLSCFYIMEVEFFPIYLFTHCVELHQFRA